MVLVDYSVSANQLIRQAGPASGTGTNSTTVVATGVVGLQTSLLATGDIEIQLSIQSTTQVVTPLMALVLRPLP